MACIRIVLQSLVKNYILDLKATKVCTIEYLYNELRL